MSLRGRCRRAAQVKGTSSSCRCGVQCYNDCRVSIRLASAQGDAVERTAQDFCV